MAESGDISGADPISRPTRYITRMLLFLTAVAVVAALLYPPLSGAFLANPVLNGMIIGVLLVGIAYNFRQVTALGPEIGWIGRFRAAGGTAETGHAPRLLAPMAAMIGAREGDLRLSATSTRSLLDGIASRLDESRDISRYLTGLLIFLGLLGTFWGLLQTIDAVAGVIGTLSVQGGDIGSAFEDLKRGLEAPLAGMGTAFSSSLFGLAGSLVLGFLDIQAGQAQNRFFRELEDWLSSVTRLSAGSALGEGEQSVPAFIEALLESTAESLDALRRAVAKGEESNIVTTANAREMTERIGTMTEQMSSEIRLLAKTIAVLAEQQRRPDGN